MLNVAENIIRSDLSDSLNLILFLVIAAFAIVRKLAQGAQQAKNQQPHGTPAPFDPDAQPQQKPSASAEEWLKNLQELAGQIEHLEKKPAPVAKKKQAHRRTRPPPIRQNTTGNLPRQPTPPLPTPKTAPAATFTAMPPAGIAAPPRISTMMLPSVAGLLPQNKRRASASVRWLRRPQSLRTAMVVHEALGPPKGASYASRCPSS